VYNGQDQVTGKGEDNHLMGFTIEIQKAVTRCGKFVKVYRVMSFDQPKMGGSPSFMVNGGIKISCFTKPAYYEHRELGLRIL
jgi:hypothetical protein